MTYTWLIPQTESFNPATPPEAAKLERVFRLLNLLATGQYTIERLAYILNVDARTIYRYFTLIDEAGFKLERQLKYYKLSRKVYPDFVQSIIRQRT